MHLKLWQIIIIFLVYILGQNAIVYLRYIMRIANILDYCLKKNMYTLYNVCNLCICIINVIILQCTLSFYEEQVAEIAIYKLYYKDIL